jgi:hypothetical protein
MSESDFEDDYDFSEKEDKEDGEEVIEEDEEVIEEDYYKDFLDEEKRKEKKGKEEEYEEGENNDDFDEIKTPYNHKRDFILNELVYSVKFIFDGLLDQIHHIKDIKLLLRFIKLILFPLAVYRRDVIVPTKTDRLIWGLFGQGITTESVIKAIIINSLPSDIQVKLNATPRAVAREHGSYLSLTITGQYYQTLSNLFNVDELYLIDYIVNLERLFLLSHLKKIVDEDAIESYSVSSPSDLYVIYLQETKELSLKIAKAEEKLRNVEDSGFEDLELIAVLEDLLYAKDSSDVYEDYDEIKEQARKDDLLSSGEFEDTFGEQKAPNLSSPRNKSEKDLLSEKEVQQLSPESLISYTSSRAGTANVMNDKYLEEYLDYAELDIRKEEREQRKENRGNGLKELKEEEKRNSEAEKTEIAQAKLKYNTEKRLNRHDGLYKAHTEDLRIIRAKYKAKEEERKRKIKLYSDEYKIDHKEEQEDVLIRIALDKKIREKRELEEEKFRKFQKSRESDIKHREILQRRSQHTRRIKGDLVSKRGDTKTNFQKKKEEADIRDEDLIRRFEALTGTTKSSPKHSPKLRGEFSSKDQEKLEKTCNSLMCNKRIYNNNDFVQFVQGRPKGDKESMLVQDCYKSRKSFCKS